MLNPNNKYLEKVAETKKKESNWQLDKALPVIIGGTVAGHLVGATGAYSTLKTMKAVDSPHSEADIGTIKKMVRDNKLDVSFNTRTHNINKVYSDTSTSINGALHEQHRKAIKGMVHPAFVPGFGKVQKSFIAGVKSYKGTANKDVIMHELGHAKDFSKHKNLKVGTLHAGRLGGLASKLALTNKKTEKYSIPIAVASTLPTLRSEGMANYHAYKGIQAHKGSASANRFLKRLVPHQMAGYAGTALGTVAGAYAGKKLLDYMNKPQVKKD